jgi:hypothetical protein
VTSRASWLEPLMTSMVILHSMVCLLLCANATNGQKCTPPPALGADLNDGLPAALIESAANRYLVGPTQDSLSTRLPEEIHLRRQGRRLMWAFLWA